MNHGKEFWRIEISGYIGEPMRKEKSVRLGTCLLDMGRGESRMIPRNYGLIMIHLREAVIYLKEKMYTIMDILSFSGDIW